MESLYNLSNKKFRAKSINWVENEDETFFSGYTNATFGEPTFLISKGDDGYYHLEAVGYSPLRQMVSIRDGYFKVNSSLDVAKTSANMLYEYWLSRQIEAMEE